jgi:hypothetical protein
MDFSYDEKETMAQAATTHLVNHDVVSGEHALTPRDIETVASIKNLMLHKKQLSQEAKIDLFIVTFATANIEPYIAVAETDRRVLETTTAEECLDILRKNMAFCIEPLHLSV